MPAHDEWDIRTPENIAASDARAELAAAKAAARSERAEMHADFMAWRKAFLGWPKQAARAEKTGSPPPPKPPAEWDSSRWAFLGSKRKRSDSER